MRCGFKLIVTFGLSEFQFCYDLFYPAHDPEGDGWSRNKRVPENISELLTPRALAYWFMDDGYSLNINQKRYYVFSTHSFPLEDHEILVKALRGNFSIEATIQKQYS